MVALCGRGGAGRDGDVVVADGGWLGGEGLLIEVLTDLEFKDEITHNISDVYNRFNDEVLKQNTPELLNRVLFTGEEQPH